MAYLPTIAPAHIAKPCCFRVHLLSSLSTAPSFSLFHYTQAVLNPKQTNQSSGDRPVPLPPPGHTHYQPFLALSSSPSTAQAVLHPKQTKQEH